VKKTTILWLACLWIGTCAGAGTLESNDIRVLAFYTNCFDYMFMSVTGVTEGKPVLGFNHLDGSTVFVREGGMVGSHSLSGFAPHADRVFNRSLNAWQTKHGGTARLSKAGEDDVILEIGKPLARPGFLVLLVKLTTGAAGYARAGDAVAWSGERARVAAIEPGSVTISCPAGTATLGFPTPEERQGLMALWETRRQEEDRRRKEAIQAVEAEQTREAIAGAMRSTPDRRLVQLTFNPLRIVEAFPGEQVVAYVFGPSGKPGGGISVKPLTLKIPMPRFHITEYRGTITTYAP
jgi:hypothetical protein